MVVVAVAGQVPLVMSVTPVDNWIWAEEKVGTGWIFLVLDIQS